MIYSFHMPAFMAVSGYVSYRANLKYSNIKIVFRILGRRIRQLVIPFLLWSVILLAVQHNLTFQSLPNIFVRPESGLWFLWVLFIINSLFVLGSWVSEVCKIKQELIIISLCAILTMVMVLFDVRVFGFQLIAYYFLFYSAGYYLSKYKNIIVVRSKLAIVSLFICWLLLSWFWKMHDVPFFLQGVPAPVSILQYAYRFITALIAIYVLFTIAPLFFDSRSKINDSLVNLGMYSLGIYTCHLIIIVATVNLLRGIFTSGTLIVFFTFVIGISLSWIVVFLLEKWSITKEYLLGKL